MRYCLKCVMPDTKPFSRFNEQGICSACLDHEIKNVKMDYYDWEKKQEEFEKIIQETKDKNAEFYDVLVPVSGGKDSIIQVSKVARKYYNLRILAVHVDYGIKTDIGKKNLSLIPKMGATLLSVTPEYNIHKQLIRIGFEDFGDPDLMSHGLLYAFPLHVAVKFNIPLVLEGENSAFEYGGDEESAKQTEIDRDWFLKHVMTKGITTDYISKKYSFSKELLKLYGFPDYEIKQKKIKAIFLSCYFKWDSEKNLQTAKKYGFQTLDKRREGTFRNYVGIDEKINRIHQYIKVLKFGYGRATDHACEEIRNNRMTREEAIELVKKYDREPLSDYYVDDFCSFLDYSKEDFYEIIEQYRNKDIWKKENNKWMIEDKF